MSENIIAALKENVIQGRMTQDDEGVDETLTGPGVLELTQAALDNNIPADEIITNGITAGMEIVGEKFNEGILYPRYAGICRGGKCSYGPTETASRSLQY